MAHGVISAGRKASWYATFDVVLLLLGRHPLSLVAKWVLDNRRPMVSFDGKIHKDYGNFVTHAFKTHVAVWLVEFQAKPSISKCFNPCAGFGLGGFR
jgi:hypothetical protein